MSYTKYTGKDIVVTYNAKAAQYVQSVEIAENGTPLPELIDTTVAGDSAYGFTADPLGAKGTATTSIRVTCLADAEDVTGTGWASIAMSTPYTVIFDKKSENGTDLFTLLTAYMMTRETVIPLAAYATRTFTLEADNTGTWSTHA
jgi:hypothetical protein